MFTPRQQPRYRALVGAAWLAHCERHGLSDDQPDEVYKAWYQDQLTECIGMVSTVGASQVDDYDLACLHFAQIAGDENAMAYFSSSAERRMRHLISDRLRSVSTLEGWTCDWHYVRSIYEHMNLPLTIDDAPAKLLWTVFKALDTHARRLRRNKKLNERNAA
jgi:hypothetical protein